MNIKLFFACPFQKTLLTLSLFIFNKVVFSQNEFITTWKTDNNGTSNSTSITIPTFPGETYNYDVDWNNDGTFDEFGITGDVTHDFSSAGTYTIRIQGTFPRIYFNYSGDRYKILSVDQWGTIAWTSMEQAFYGASNLIGNATDVPDLSGVTSMAYMFGGTAFNQDVSGWDTSTITDMIALFAGDSVFNQDLSSWNTSNVTKMALMFNGAVAFNQDISSWVTTKVTDMGSMFWGATTFNQDIGSWDTSNVINMGYMFNAAPAFNQDLSSWVTSKVIYMWFMFQDAIAFNNGGQPLTWDTGAVTNMKGMFKGATAFNQDLSSWTNTAVTTMESMFYGATSFNNGSQPMTWGTGAVTMMRDMFKYATAFDQDISSWDMNSVDNMSGMFNESNFNNGGAPANWNLSAVTNMGGLFANNPVFNQDISSWNTANVTDMGSMFNGSTSFNNGGQPMNLNTTSVTNMTSMFNGATAFNQDISGWDFSKVTNISQFSMFEGATAFNNGGQPLTMNTNSLNNMTNMFKVATAFNQPLSLYTTNLVTSASMFEGATSFNQDISGWNTGSLVTLDRMFKDATAFNNGGQPLSWNTYKVRTTIKMFENATAFDQDLGGWNVTSLLYAADMFLGAKLSDANYDALLIGWNAQVLKANVTFNGGDSQYCSTDAQTARANMIASDGWTITDGGMCTLGLDDHELDKVLIYPNPVQEKITIALKVSASYALVNLLGQVVQKGSLYYGDNILDISNLSKGLYVLNVKTPTASTSKKIIKE